ncbi:hypothetical protein BKI52_30770 [marine bacterium AO1-C]|nr:hypothetical protein BKI52_30770 [marine bacterium AO1-C]
MNLLTATPNRMDQLYYHKKRLYIIFNWCFLLFSVCFLSINHTVQGQNAQTDSLKKLLAASKADTQRVKILNRLCRGYWRHSPDTSRIISQQALELAQKLDFTLGIANANNAIAISYYFQGNYVQAVEYYKKALASHQKIDNKRGVSRAYNNLGVLYSKKGDYAHSLEYYHKALVIQEELNDERLMAKSYNNIGNIYLDINEYPKALEFHQKALAIKRKLKASPSSMMYTYTNLGNVYKSMESYKEALGSYRSALKICLTENLLKDAALSYTLMGFVMNFQNKLDSAIYYQKKSLEIARRDSLKNIELEVLYRLSFVYSRKKELKKAIDFGKQAVTLGLQNKEYPFVKDAAKVVADSYTQLKNYGQALKYQTIYLQSKDSLFNDNKTKELTRLELNYAFDKKQAILKAEQKAKEDKIKIENEKKLQRERFYLLGTLGVLFAVLAISIFALRSRTIQKKLNQQLVIQKDELQEQKQELVQLNEELQQNQEEIITQRDYIEKQNINLNQQQHRIQSSIRAARTIQQAMLPFEQDLQSLLQDYFVIYRPKDIVSGDFYWLKQVGDDIIIVVADCTGHGVPGAFMSLIGMNLLDKIVFQKNITVPRLILDDLHQQMNLALRQKNAQQVRGGMDAVVLKLSKQDDHYSRVVFAGAKNPLYYFVPDADEIQIIKADRKSIGALNSKVSQFNEQEIHLPQGSVLYAGSDGIQDQNDAARKKLGSQRLIQVLNQMAPQPMSAQKQMLEECIDQHMKDTTQRDDMLWIGIKV